MYCTQKVCTVAPKCGILVSYWAHFHVQSTLYFLQWNNICHPFVSYIQVIINAFLSIVLDNEDTLNDTITATYKSAVIFPCQFENPIWLKNQTELFLQVCCNLITFSLWVLISFCCLYYVGSKANCVCW